MTTQHPDSAGLLQPYCALGKLWLLVSLVKGEEVAANTGAVEASNEQKGKRWGAVSKQKVKAPDRTGRLSPASWKTLHEDGAKKTAKQKWCNRWIRTDRGMARQSSNISNIVQKVSVTEQSIVHICPHMSTFLEKPIWLSFTTLAYLIRNNKPDRLAFLKRRQRKKDHFSSLKSCVCSFEKQ